MTADEWKGLIYRAIGIPDAVKDKDEIAVELLNQVWAENPRNSREAEMWVQVIEACLVEVAKAGERGSLDRLLAGLVSVEDVTERLQQVMVLADSTWPPPRLREMLGHLLSSTADWVIQHKFAGV